MRPKSCVIVSSGKFVGTNRYLAVALAAVVIAAGAAGTPTQSVRAAAGPIWLGTHSFGRILVDPASLQVFISSPGDNSIVVLDLAGNIIKTITGEPGANAMLVLGSTLYVSLFSTGTIDRIDIPTLTETNPLVTGLVQPGNLAYAGGKLWTTTNNLGTIQLDSVDLSVQTPSVTVYSGAFNNTNMLASCASFAVNHASNPSYLLMVSCGGSISTIDLFDVSGTTPVESKSITISGNYVRDLAVNPNGSHFIVALPNFGFIEYNLSDLTTDGISYPSDNFPVAVDSTSANGTKMVGGISRQLGTTDTVAYPIGDISQVIASASFGQFTTNTRGVGISPDGLTAYVVAGGLSCYPGTCQELNLISLPALPPGGSPAVPTNVTAIAGVGAASVSWVAPTYHGTSPITGYTVSSSGGASVSVGPSVFNTIIAGLSPVPHTFTVAASNSSGTSSPSDPSNSVTPFDGGTFHALTPQRILDTRNGNGGLTIRRVAANSDAVLQVTGRGGVPSSGVSAVVLNVAVTSTTGSGYVTAYPSGLTGFGRPLASNLNFVRGATVSNLVQVEVGPTGKVNLFVGGAAADLVADVEGWVGDSTNSSSPSGLFNPSGPGRIWDSRYVSTANGDLHEPLGPGQSIALRVYGFWNYTLDESAVVLNVAVTNPSRAGYFTVYPTGTQRPLTSNLNFAAGQTVANRVIVAPGADGTVTIFNGLGTADVVVDINGWFSGPNGTGSAFITGMPGRLFDSRSCACKLLGGYSYYFPLTGPPTTALSLNVAVTNTTAFGFLTLYPDNGTQGQLDPPLASDLNFTPGQTVANMTILMLGPNMAFNVYNGYGSTDIVIDVDGIYGPLATPLYGGGPPITPIMTREPRSPTRLPSMRGPAQPLGSSS